MSKTLTGDSWDFDSEHNTIFKASALWTDALLYL